MSDVNNTDFTFKVVISGSCGVGKTNLISRFIEDKFDDSQLSTIGVDFRIKSLSILGYDVKIQFWDTAGQEKHRSIANSYYKESNGAILVYDMTSLETFEKLNFWYNELLTNSPKYTKTILVGNKSDLIKERRVSYDQAL